MHRPALPPADRHFGRAQDLLEVSNHEDIGADLFDPFHQWLVGPLFDSIAAIAKITCEASITTDRSTK
jgi:hypothetical protein